MQTHTELSTLAERATALISAEIEQGERELAELREKHAVLSALLGTTNGNGTNARAGQVGRPVVDWRARIQAQPRRFKSSDLGGDAHVRASVLQHYVRRGVLKRIAFGEYEKVGA